MKKTVRILSLIICLSILFSSFLIPVFATQSKYENFDISEVTMTSDAGKNMAAVALSQTGKTGQDFGYTEEWCADFVGDCAILTGQSDAVPLYGGVEGLYTKLIDKAAVTITDTPKAGDLIFINWNGEARKAHIEIIYDFDEETNTVYTVGGNTGSFSTVSERRVSTHKLSLSSDKIKAILRPDYSSCESHSYIFFTCKSCGALHPEISSLINAIKAFIYNIKNMLDSIIGI